MYRNNANTDILSLLRGSPSAQAAIDGSNNYPQITGLVRFYETPRGVLVFAQISGLPSSAEKCENAVFGLHIHEGASCSGNSDDPFADAGQHYDPDGCPHPYHAGDLPPLFEANGTALSIFLTNRSTVSEIIGKTVILHSRPDDFTTQPSGNSGEKMACGIIRG